MDKTTEMTIFCHAVDDGGFTAAARKLNLTPSAVSKQMSRLEDRLGVRLLNRTTRRLSLTEEGRLFYERSKAILADIEETEQALSASLHAPRGTLRIGASVAFGRSQLVQLLPTFMARYPDVTVDLELTDRAVNLVEEGIDVVIRIAALSDSSYIARKLAINHRIVCAAPSYLANYGVPETPQDLLAHNCLRLNEVNSQFNDWEFISAQGKSTETIQVRGNFISNHGDTVYEATLAGMGISRLSDFLVGEHIKAGRLVPLLTEYSHEMRAIYALYPHRRHLSPKVRAFVDFMVEQYSPAPPWETEHCRQRRLAIDVEGEPGVL